LAKSNKKVGKLLGETVRQRAGQSSKEVRLERIKWRSDGGHLAEFAKIYLAKEFKGPIPEFHLEYFERFYSAERNMEVWPRGHAKTTIQRLIQIYHIATANRDDLIPPEEQLFTLVQVAKTLKIAKSLTRNVRKAFLLNPLLKEDFGELVGDVRAADEIEFTNDAKLVASGYGGTVRGAQGQDARRPDAVFIDDLVDKKTSKSREQMADIVDWIESDVLGLGDEKTLKINMYGNRRHRLDPFGIIIEDPDRAAEWNITTLDAVVAEDEDGMIIESLWPTKYSPASLESKRRLSERGFRVEYRNRPYEAGELTFNKEMVQSFSFPAELVKDWICMGRAAVDVAGPGEDYSSIGFARRPAGTKQTWIFRGKRKRGMRAKEIVDYVMEVLEQDGWTKEVMVEAIGIGIPVYEDLQDRVKEAGLSVRVTRVDNHYRTERKIPLNKEERIVAKQTRVDNGDIRVAKELKWLIDELGDYPDVEHDDACDMMEMLDSGFEKRGETKGPRYSGVGVVGGTLRVR